MDEMQEKDIRQKMTEINRKAHLDAQEKKWEKMKEEKKKDIDKIKKGPIKPLEERLDDAEKALDSLVNIDRNVVAIMFFLKTKGRHRGYIENAKDDEFDLEKLKALKDFFSSIPNNAPAPPPQPLHPQVHQEQEPPLYPPNYEPPESPLKSPQKAQEPPKDLGLYKARTSPRDSNFS